MLDHARVGALESRDPRWTVDLALDGGLFDLQSTSTTEVRLTNGQTKPIVETVTMRGAYRRAGDRLVLTFRPPLAGAARDRAVGWFGAPAADGTYRPKVAIPGMLSLTSPDGRRELVFGRRKRPL